MTEEETAGFGGNRVILALYAIVVSVAGLMGGVIGSIGLRNVLEALLKDDFTLKVTSRGGDRRY